MLVAVVLGSIAVVSFVNFVRADFIAYQPNSSISVTSDGFTLYPFFVGPRVDVARVGMLAVLGVVAPLFLGFCSVVLFAILAFLRYQAGRNTPVPVPAGSGPYAAS